MRTLARGLDVSLDGGGGSKRQWSQQVLGGFSEFARGEESIPFVVTGSQHA